VARKPELDRPAPDRFAADFNAALRKQLFHIAEAQHEPEVEPHCVADDRWWETVPFERNSAHLPCPTTGAANGAAGARLAFA